MKNSQIKIWFYINLVLIIIIFTCCKKHELTEDEKLTQHEQKIIENMNDFMPNEVKSFYEDFLNDIHGEVNNDLYLDSIETAIDELKSSIELSFTLEDYKKALSNSLTSLESSGKGSINSCLGLGYGKGLSIEGGVSGTVGYIIAMGLQASGGGGVKVIYDFVNLERQIYYYTFCGTGVSFGVGIAATLKANVGFSGINEIKTGIRYHGSNSGLNSFQGQAIGSSFSLDPKISVAFGGGVGLGLGVGISTSHGAIADFTGTDNLSFCPEYKVQIENGVTSYSVKVSGNFSAAAGFSELAAYLSLNTTMTNSTGVKESYKKFVGDRKLAGLRMAKEICIPNPISGITSIPGPVDLAASSIALLYSFIDFSNCPAEIPAIGTRPINNIQSTSALSGGIIKDNRGASIITRGVCWSTSQNPTINSSKTTDGAEIGTYTSNLTGLKANTTYYVRAYATNSAGTGYGKQISFTTPPIPNQAPLTPSSPSPANGASGISSSATLTWECSDPDSDPLTYDLYIGTNSNSISLERSGITAKTYTTYELNHGTTYYWKVVAIDNHSNSTSGSVWSFTTTPGSQTGTVADIEGNVYNTVTIGTQTWMKENLKVTKFNDGTTIPNIADNTTWAALTTPAYCCYNNEATLYKNEYGALYNWYAVTSNKLCPTGWHVPSLNEWNVLGTYLGGNAIAGGKLKEVGYNHWLSPNTNATNTSNFTALPGSSRDFNGSWGGTIGTVGVWWSNTQIDAVYAYYFYLAYNSEALRSSNPRKVVGLSVRCLKDN